MRFLKLSLRIFGFLIALAIIVPILAIAAMQVSAGRAFVSGVVSNLVSTDGRIVRVEGLYLGFGLNGGLERLTVADEAGVWLAADRITLSWNPLQLISGELDISSVTAGQVDLERQPSAPQDEAASASSKSDGSTGFSLPVDVTLDSFRLGEINLGPALLGTPVSLNASGSGAFAANPALLTAHLDVHRIDGVDAGLIAAAEFEPAAEKLAFDITVSEPRGGLAARLLEVPDLPALRLELKGDGPLTNWAAKLNLALDGRTTVTGSARIEEDTGGRHLSFDLDGDLAPLAPPEVQAFLLGTTNASGQARFSGDFAPQSAQLALTTRTVSLNASADLTSAEINATANLSVSAGENALIAVELANRRIAFGPVKADFTVSGQRSSADWSSEVSIASFQTAEVRTGEMDLKASGSGANLTPTVMTSPFRFSLAIAGLEGLTKETAPLSGPVSLQGNGTADGKNKSLQIAGFSVSTTAGQANLTDSEISASKIDARGRLSVPDLAMFSGLAGRNLAGSLAGTFSADLDPDTLTGSATGALVLRELKTDVSQADALLTGESNVDLTLDLAGRDDVTVKSLAVKNEALEIRGNAHYQKASLTSDLTVRLEDLSKVDPRLEGGLALDVRSSGPLGALEVQANATSQQILLAGTPLDDLSFSADATADPAAPTAAVKGTASLNGQPIAVDVVLTSKDGGADVEPLSIRLAGNTVTGALSIADVDKPVETLKGDLKIDAPDLASLSPLLLTDISGRLQGTLSANPQDRTLAVDVTGADIGIPSVSFSNLKLKANVAAPYAPENITADIQLAGLLTDATPIHSADISVTPDGDGTAITAQVAMDRDNRDGLTLKARVSELDSGAYVLALQELALHYQGLTSALKQPTTISYSGGEAIIDPLELRLGNGSLSVAGKAGQSLDLTAKLKSVPLNLANAFLPSLGLGGTLSGSVAAKGSASSPEAEWTVTGASLTSSDLSNNSLTALDLTSSGSLKSNEITQTTRVSDPNGLNLTAAGTIGLSRPNALSISLEGTVPLAVVRRPLLDAGLRGEGSISLQGTVTGNVADPSYQITATPADLKITSLTTGLTAQNIGGTVSVSSDQAVLNGIAGDLATGGTFSAEGTVGMKDGLTADIALKLNNGRYVDPGLVTADIDADLKISGPLASPAGSALIDGKVTINKADISIPENLPGAIPPVDVRHVNASKAVQQQAAELGGGSRQTGTQERRFPPRLDILLSAPGRIFVRGRGLDAELQGELKIVGTTTAPQAIGAFSLRRGQLDILTRRLLFSHGTATFEGSLTPVIDFAATTSVSDTTITVSVSGAADDPQIAFTSSPELPQDEVLALLLFGKSVGNLSPTQIARLAAAIATLTGGNDNGPLASIRKSLGLDAIDVNTNGENGPSVSVGKYINDNIYLGVEQGTGTSSSRVQVDIDLNRGLKVRGEVGADGSSKAGIFFEKEY
ncbi:translocation/assembly module TamB domain-containing protein [Roseibium marinum]|uniref:Translocation and assembly module TamB n=1 Tax=Roseibium marinum TaxID=281252 RepID=A0A2S3UNC9_9HYPH|nr:translocation/assembly module TamB domain-containing protein [Roseibium marinum]POF29184.1 translocation and assembly module TamB [Roseibium marinum]